MAAAFDEIGRSTGEKDSQVIVRLITDAARVDQKSYLDELVIRRLKEWLESDREDLQARLPEWFESHSDEIIGSVTDALTDYEAELVWRVKAFGVPRTEADFERLTQAVLQNCLSGE